MPSIGEWHLKIWDLFLQDKISMMLLIADNVPRSQLIMEKWRPLLTAASLLKIDASLFAEHEHLDLLSDLLSCPVLFLFFLSSVLFVYWFVYLFLWFWVSFLFSFWSFLIV